MKGEGQFTALLRKKGSGGNRKPAVPFPAPDRKAAGLLQQAIPGIPEPNAVFGNTLIRIPECPDLKGVRILRAGLQLAEIRGKNPVPDHAAAMSFLQEGRIPRLETDGETAAKYIAGEEIPGNAAGWTLVCFRGLVLGWGKGSGGTVKNHYPKGLRKERILTGSGA